MIRVAVVEDEDTSLKRILECLKQYEEEEGICFVISVFRDGFDFISEYRPFYDIVFMDVEMPMLNGISAAKKMRKIDPSVALIFVTRLRQYALFGYEVDAVGYLLKPLEYFSFQHQIKKFLDKNRFDYEGCLVIKTVDGVVKVNIDKIIYVESDGHYLVYHTTDGLLRAYGQLSTVVKSLPEDKFFRCHKSFYIHLKYVKKIGKDTVFMGRDEVPVSRPNKKALLETFNRYIGRTIYG